jgi:hypothetical protein
MLVAVGIHSYLYQLAFRFIFCVSLSKSWTCVLKIILIF